MKIVTAWLMITLVSTLSTNSFALKKSFYIQNHSHCDIHRNRPYFNIYRRMTDQELNGPEIIDKYSSATISIDISELDNNDRPMPYSTANYAIYCNNSSIFRHIEPPTGYINFEYNPKNNSIVAATRQQVGASGDIRVYILS